jgi:outer membrane protein TolC
MTQRSVEMVIGKLVSDEDLRDLFRRDRQAAIRAVVAQGLELNAVEIGGLLALDADAFEQLARSIDARLQKASLRPPRKGRRGTGALVVWLALAGAARADTPEAPLTLEHAIATALQANRQVQDATLQVQRDGEAIGEAKTRRLPAFEMEALGGKTLAPVSVTFPAGSLGGFPSTGPIPSEDTKLEGKRNPSAYVSASIGQPLSQLYKVGLNVKMAETAREIDREKLRAERAALVADVRRVYYTILQTQSSLDAALQQGELLQEMDRVVGEYVKVETALRADGLEVSARVAAVELQVLSVRNALAGLKEQMNDLLGRDIATPFEVAPVPDPALDEETLERARAQALANRPEVQQARLSVQQADTQRRLKKADYIPEISLALTYSSFYGIDLLPRNVAQAGVRVKWEPFDWGRRAKQTASATLQLEQAKNGARTAESRVALEVGRRFRALGEAQQMLKVRRASREAAMEKTRVALLRHQEQASLLKDALEARTALADADAQYQQALLGYWTARADFEKAMGEEQ